MPSDPERIAALERRVADLEAQLSLLYDLVGGPKPVASTSEYPGELLGHLESFCVLLRHAATHRKGTFERAAHELHVDRSVLRRRVATLEAWIGAPLVEGRGATLAPTEVGERVREAAARMLRDGRRS